VAALRDLDLGRGRRLSARCLSVRFSRAGGPGGQNVNKVATRAELRLDLGRAEAALGPRAVARIRACWPRRFDAKGRLRVVCGRSRHQARNVELACARMEELLREALVVRRPRRDTKPTTGSRERRLRDKRAAGARKRDRGAVRDDD